MYLLRTVLTDEIIRKKLFDLEKAELKEMLPKIPMDTILKLSIIQEQTNSKRYERIETELLFLTNY